MSAKITTTMEDLMLLRADARGFSFLPKQPVASLLSSRHHSRLRGRGLAFEELRHYHQGDDIRTMDWKATARTRTPHVRVFNEERERAILLLVDQRGPMFFGSRRAMKSVVAAELAALGAWRSLHSGDRVGGLIFNDREIVSIRPHRSQGRVLQLLNQVVRHNQQLASDQENSRSVSLNQVLESALKLARHDFLVVLISDLDGADDETQRLSTLIASHNDMLVAAVYDPLGASLMGAPGMIATDRGKDWNIPPGDTFSSAFRLAFGKKLETWTTIFRHLRVPVLPFSTAEPVADQLRTLFGKRA